MKKFERVSPSQIESYQQCKRLWWFKSIAGIKPPEKASAQLGTAVHAILEKYMLEGEIPDSSTDEGAIAKSGIHHLPPPGTCQIELSIEDYKDSAPLFLSGIPVIGRIDLLNFNNDYPEAIDHKTTSNFKYLKSEDELRDNPQINIYAQFVRTLLENSGTTVDKYRVTHIGYLTRGKRNSRRTSVLLTRDDLDNTWAKLDKIVESMKQTALSVGPHLVEPTRSSCNAYGGCYFKDKCRVIDNTSLALDIFSEDFDNKPGRTKKEEKMAAMDINAGTQALMERLKASGAVKNSAPNPAATAAPKPAATAAPKPAAAVAKPAVTAAPKPVAAAVAKPAATVATPAKPNATVATAARPAAPAPRQVEPGTASTAQALLERMKKNQAATTVQQAKPAPAAPAVNKGVVPPDAPTAEQDSEIVEGIAQSAEQTAAQKSTRRPHQFRQKLDALGWDSSTIDRMTPEACSVVIQQGYTPEHGAVSDDGEFQLFEGVEAGTEATADDAFLSLANDLKEFIGDQTGTLSSAKIRFKWQTKLGGEPLEEDQWLLVLRAGSLQGWWDYSVSEIIVPEPVVEPEPVEEPEAEQAAVSDEVIDSTSTASSPFHIKEATYSAQKKAWSTPADWNDDVRVAPAVAKAPGQKGLVIFIDCVPQRGHWSKNFVLLEDLLGPFFSKAAKSLGVPHYSVASFNEGPKHVAMLVHGNLKNVVERWPTIVVSSRMGAASSVLEVLIPEAELIVRGS